MLGEDFPKTEQAFHARFSDEEACREYVSSVRWPEGFVCPKCGHKGGWRRKGREEWVCSAKACGKETSLRAGTVFHRSPKPLREWLLAMLHVTISKQGMSDLELQHRLGFGTYRTALRWLRELRRAMGQALADREPLGPEVEVDETAVGGVDEGGGSGSMANKVWAVGAIERLPSGCGRARMKVVEGKNAEQVCGFVESVVRRGSLVCTDDGSLYHGLSARGFFHDPRPIRSKNPKRSNRRGESVAEAHLPRVHRVVSLVKRVVLGAHQGSWTKEHLQAYLDEYCFRFDGKNLRWRIGMVRELLGGALRMQCVPYWKSSGRIAPDVPTRRQNRVWRGFGLLLSEESGG